MPLMGLPCHSLGVEVSLCCLLMYSWLPHKLKPLFTRQQQRTRDEADCGRTQEHHFSVASLVGEESYLSVNQHLRWHLDCTLPTHYIPATVQSLPSTCEDQRSSVTRSIPLRVLARATSLFNILGITGKDLRCISTRGPSPSVNSHTFPYWGKNTVVLSQPHVSGLKISSLSLSLPLCSFLFSDEGLLQFCRLGSLLNSRFWKYLQQGMTSIKWNFARRQKLRMLHDLGRAP